MDQVRACRICLTTGVKMNDLRCYPLVNYFESIAGMSAPAAMDLPPYACYECTAYIRNTFLFREKCLRGQSTLYNMLRLTGKITETSIQSVDRLHLNLISNIKYNVIPNHIIHVLHEKPDVCEIKVEPSNEVILPENNEEVEVSFFKAEVEFTNVDSPVIFNSDDDDEPLSFHKSYKEAVEIKVDKEKGKKKIKSDGEVDMEDEAVTEKAEGTSQKNDPPEGTVQRRKRGRPRKNEEGPVKKERSAISRRTKNTGGVDDNDIDLEEYVTIIKLTKEEQLEEITKRQTSSNYQNAPYKCNLCFKGFIDTDAWEHHVSKHQPDENSNGESSDIEHFEVRRVNAIKRNRLPEDVIVISSDSDSDAVKEENITWILHKTFPSHHAAKSAVASKGTWSLYNCHYTQNGYKKIYKCDTYKKIRSDCPAKLCLSFKTHSRSVVMYRSDSDHSHDQENNLLATCGISDHVKAEIKKMFELKMTPETIMNELAKGIAIPDVAEVKKYLCDLRRAKLESQNISLTELNTWIQSREGIPNDPHEVFVICQKIIEGDAEFSFALSNKYLLGIAKEAIVIHVDTRYKFMWQGYPVFVFGTTDKNHKFHPLCLAISSSEEKEHFELIFNGLKNRVEELLYHGVIWKPQVLVCDAAQNIQRAFIDVFGDDVVVRTCWTHAHWKMSEKLHNRLFHREILADIEALYVVTNPNTFDKASKAFLLKYRDLSVIVNYFEEQWLRQNRNWYLGAAPNSPTTNAALSSFMYEHLNQRIQPNSDLHRFLDVASRTLKQWSQRYVTRPDLSFAKEATITLKEWQKSYNWANMPKDVTVMHKDDSHIYYRVPAAEATECEEFEEPWESFDDFKVQNNSVWFVSLPVNRDCWRQGRCDCPAFYKMYICKHVIGMAIRLGYVIPPAEAQVLYRKRRRPWY